MKGIVDIADIVKRRDKLLFLDDFDIITISNQLNRATGGQCAVARGIAAVSFSDIIKSYYRQM